jgi:hypothetical protein
MNMEGEFLVKDPTEKKFSIRDLYQVIMTEEKSPSEKKPIQKSKRQYKMTILLNGNKPPIQFIVDRDGAD